jgi:pectinesterase
MQRRNLLKLALFGLAGVGHPAAWARAKLGFDAVVGQPISGLPDIPVYGSIAAALAAAPSKAIQPHRIHVGLGRWHEKLLIEKPNIHLVGAHRTGSVLCFDAAAGMQRPDGQPWGTWGCASVTVRAPGFQASNLSIENDFDYIGNLRAPQFEAIGPNGAQAVALMLAEGSDRSLLEDVDIIGHQDTLFVESGRSLFRNCLISGSVDFIFGAGQAFLERCEIISRYRPGKERQGYIAVPSTPETRRYGLVFSRCRLQREAEIPDASVALGRAWRPGRKFADGQYGDPAAIGSAVYLNCWMDAHIDPKGWDAMAYTARNGERVLLQPEQARLFEYASTGPGARLTPGRRQLDSHTQGQYARKHVLGDWRP